jgi:hypothetical protein
MNVIFIGHADTETMDLARHGCICTVHGADA